MPIFFKKEVLIPVMMKLRIYINNTNFKIFLIKTSLVGKGYKTSLSTCPFVEENPVLIAIPLFYFLFLNCKMVVPYKSIDFLLFIKSIFYFRCFILCIGIDYPVSDY